jgi:ubiquinone/menaquinone biosynthesis C-methylase UbiE
MTWIAAVVILVILGYVLEREIYFYEGVHLGPRLQAWLYDRWSRNYDAGKRESQLQDDTMLAGPLLAALDGVPEPFVLDFATGTGRLSQALLSQEGFPGRIVALDLSQGMLEQAAAKLNRYGGRVELLRHAALPLPFEDATFDAVCALEVLELFPDMDAPVREFGRVLRPGGVLLTSRGTEQSGRKAKVKSAREFTSLLTRHGLAGIQITRWWKLFDRVLAHKSGVSLPVGARDLTSTLCCPSCREIRWQRETSRWRCAGCGGHVEITRHGIVLA